MTNKNRGFALMTKEEHKKIAQMGGRAAQQKGLAHHWDSESARAAGRKGAAKRILNMQLKAVPK
jgi:general stress protein YciG